MTSKKKSATGGKTRKLKVKKETIRDLDPKASRKVKGGLDSAISACECTQNLCKSGNVFCNPVTVGCQTLQCMPTFWSCNKL